MLDIYGTEYRYIYMQNYDVIDVENVCTILKVFTDDLNTGDVIERLV